MWDRALFISLVSAALAMTGCTQDSRQSDAPAPPVGGLVCTDVYIAGLAVEVRDALTGDPAAYGAVGVIRDGSYTETLQAGGIGSMDPSTALKLVGAWERAGVYSVLVRKSGYRDWSATAVVEADNCHVHPVTLQAFLERAG